MMNNIIHDETAGQFYLLNGSERSLLSYKKVDNETLNLMHTFVPDKLRGRGIASDLVEEALEFAKSKSLQVIPTCPFVELYIKRHPQYQKLLHSNMHHIAL